MDRLTRYREIARNVLKEYTKYKVSHGDISTEGIADPEKDHYSVLHVGWDRGRRIHGLALHFDIIDNKFWIQYDGMDYPVVEELEAAGVPKEDIVLAFHEPEIRKLTGYAVG
jgi:hypothetical protein